MKINILKITILILLSTLILIESIRTILIFKIDDLKLITSFVSAILGFLIKEILAEFKTIKNNRKNKKKKED